MKAITPIINGTDRSSSFPRLVRRALGVVAFVGALVAGSGLAPRATAQTFSGPFVHPGVLVNKGQLDYIKQQVNAGIAPWSTAFTNAKNSTLGSLTYTATPYATIDGTSTVETALVNDSAAAYTQAILWYVTGNATYAQNAINILNAWSSTLTSVDTTSSQAILDAAWAGENFPRGAEIIRYLYPGWSSTNITQFQNMLQNIIVPPIQNGRPYGYYGGNQNNSMAEAMLNIGVFNENLTDFNDGLSMWRVDLPAYIYMTSDGAIPAKPLNWTTTEYTASNMATYWYNAPYINGMSEETYRDLGHVRWGIAGLCNGAETAYQQGVDLYGESSYGTLNAVRMQSGLELNASYILSPPSGITLGSSVGTWEIGYNHLVNRLSYSLPNTNSYLQTVRPTGSSFFMSWETLTHYGQGMNGFSSTPPPAPTGLSATAGNAQVSLTWVASTGATSYNVKRATVTGGPYTILASPTSTSYTDATVTNGTTYYYVVSAVNSHGESANSSEVNATPEPIPAAPTGLTATAASSSQINLSWTASTGAATYNILRGTTSGGPYTTVATGVVSTSYSDSGLTANTTYYYVVQAVNSYGTSGNSNEASATTLAGVPPAPTSLRATASRKAGRINLSWTQSTGSGLTANNVYRSTTSGGPYTKIATLSPTTTYGDTGLTTGTTYYYVVTAVNGSGESAYSNQASAKSN